MNDVPINIPEAPAWALWAGVFGKNCILAAATLFLLSLVCWILRPKSDRLEIPARIAFAVGSLCLIAAFGVLASLFVNNQFEFQYVAEHGGKDTDLKYKIAGIWTAQEGSFLLWSVTSAIFGLISVRGTGIYRRWYTSAYSLFLGTLAAILAFESPFNIFKGAIAHGKIFQLPDGSGMTPSLQNYWVVIHPPTIFTGFGCLTVFFAYAVAAMLQRNATDWVARVRPWALFTTGILGLGICMGGLWAYETQGWGGFWAWDPVENASFVPWLFTLVFVHGVLVQATKKTWGFANLVLGGLPFISFLYGTFLTRSGLLDKVSVHSFATMDQSALGILRWFMVGIVVAFFGLVFTLGRTAAKQAAPPKSEPESGVSREGFYRFGMLILALSAVVISIGMSWPVITALRGGEGSKVEEALYHQVMIWFFIPLMLLMAIAPFVSWRSMSWKDLWARIFTVTCIAVGLTGFIQMGLMSPKIGVHPEAGAVVTGLFHVQVPLTFWMMLLVFLCVYVAVANIYKAAELVKRSPTGIGGFLAHLGLAIFLGGMVISRGYQRDERIFVRDGSPAVGLDYLVTYKKLEQTDPFNRDGKVLLDVQGPNGNHFDARPGLYEYGDPDNPQDMVWPYIQRSLSHDVYISMNPPVRTAWEQPQSLKPGGSVTLNGATVEYLRFTMDGKPGTVGVQFGCDVRLTMVDDNGESHQYFAHPTVTVTPEGLQPSIPVLGPDYRVAMINGVNPTDKSAQFMLFFYPPIYPITIYYKPLTCLVWIGAFVMTVGGLLSAYSRRTRLKTG